MNKVLVYLFISCLVYSYVPRNLIHDCSDEHGVGVSINHGDETTIQQEDCDFCSIDLFHVAVLSVLQHWSHEKQVAGCFESCHPDIAQSTDLGHYLRGPPVVQYF